MKEYKTIDDLPDNLKIELDENKSFFDDFDGKSLDEQQRIACVLNDCDLEIIAGAGTGKTYTLLAKAAYLIERKNVLPDNILFLSFSKSCVEELIERINYDVLTSTIHAYGLSLIDEYREKEVFDGWGFRKIFDEYLETASDKALSDIKDYCMDNLKSEDMIKLIELDTEAEKFNHLVSKSRISSRIRHFIDLFKGKGYSADDFKKVKAKCKQEFDTNDGNYFTKENYLKNMSFIQIVEPVFRFYEGYLSRNHLIDFNDMINKAVDLIETQGINDNFKYIFVDEFQDMSYKNFQFIKTLKESCNAHLVVVGDDWQSIYGFRDSDIDLFNNFVDYFPGAHRVFIEKTYRNPQELIDIAGGFIMKNESQFKKSLKSDKSIENPLKIVYDDDCDAIYNLIQNLSNESEKVFILGRHNGDIDKFIAGTELVKKTKNEFKLITDGTIDNVEYRTVHKAKGLEADYVVLINVYDDQIGFPNKLHPPYFMNLMHDWDYAKKLDEERRLFYVAITRAKKGVYIFTKDYKQSSYVDELIEDNELELIYGEDFNQLSEFEGVDIDISCPNDSDGIEIKANQKDIGNDLIKSKDYDEAEDFYKKLISNMYYLNDYYPYRKLVEVYVKKKDNGNVINTIEEFFKSERYCSNYQLLWFKLKYKKACSLTGCRFSKFEDCLNYFRDHGLKNRDLQNDPVPIAARIKTSGKKVKVIPQKDHDIDLEYNELRLKYKFADKYESGEKALVYYEQLWKRREFRKNLTAYRKLCSLYDGTGQYEKVIEIGEQYFNSDARKTKSSLAWFDKKLNKAHKKLGKSNVKKKSPSKAKNSSMSRDELLFKYAELYEKGLLTKEEFDLKKKELLFNNTSVENDSSIDNVITVARNNFAKLLSSEIGDEIIVRRGKNKIKLEVISISNPKCIREVLHEEVTVGVNKNNFSIVENIDFGEELIIKHKNVPGEIILEKLD